ncbi:MAG: hypothetical protein LBH98_04530 [Chitinispirillales bacterium]|jgi:lipopolysaccharide export LptBFGC system permease protein LptF|nr:hypothetical protein [Chitinispirillales bacterium]
MKLYYKISPILMFIGFAVLAVGVILSMSYYSRITYVLVGFGFITYIVGRIGIHLTPKNVKNEETEN